MRKGRSSRPAECRQGEVCGGRRHRVLPDGTLAECECLALSRRDQRYTAGGFPTAYLTLNAETAVEQAKLKGRLKPNTLRRLGCGLITGKLRPLLITQEHGVVPVVLGAYLMLQVALSRPVLQTRIQEVVDDSFLVRGESRRWPAHHAGLLLRLGNDPPHSFNGSTLVSLVQARAERWSPTVVIVEREMAAVEGIYSSHALMRLRELTEAIL